MQTINERFLYYVEALFQNDDAIAAKTLGCTRAGIRRIRNGAPPGGLLLLRLCENAYVNANWLLRGDIPQRPMSRSLQDVAAHIDLLYSQQAIHVRRGYRITKTKPIVVAMHLLEETVELIESVTTGGDAEAIIEEAGDVLGVYLHLLRHAARKHPQANITIETVIDGCLDKLKRYWTSNPALVTAQKPGFGRRNRGKPPEG